MQLEEAIGKIISVLIAHPYLALLLLILVTAVVYLAYRLAWLDGFLVMAVQSKYI